MSEELTTTWEEDIEAGKRDLVSSAVSLISAGKHFADAKSKHKDQYGGTGWEAEINNYGLSFNTVNTAIQAYDVFGENVANVRDVSASVLRLLAAPSTPEAVRKEVITKSQEGKTYTVAEVKAMRDKWKEQAKEEGIQQGIQERDKELLRREREWEKAEREYKNKEEEHAILEIKLRNALDKAKRKDEKEALENEIQRMRLQWKKEQEKWESDKENRDFKEQISTRQRVEEHMVSDASNAQHGVATSVGSFIVVVKTLLAHPSLVENGLRRVDEVREFLYDAIQQLADMRGNSFVETKLDEDTVVGLIDECNVVEAN